MTSLQSFLDLEPVQKWKAQTSDWTLEILVKISDEIIVRLRLIDRRSAVLQEEQYEESERSSQLPFYTIKYYL